MHDLYLAAIDIIGSIGLWPVSFVLVSHRRRCYDRILTSITSTGKPVQARNIIGLICIEHVPVLCDHRKLISLCLVIPYWATIKVIDLIRPWPVSVLGGPQCYWPDTHQACITSSRQQLMSLALYWHWVINEAFFLPNRPLSGIACTGRSLLSSFYNGPAL